MRESGKEACRMHGSKQEMFWVFCVGKKKKVLKAQTPSVSLHAPYACLVANNDVGGPLLKSDEHGKRERRESSRRKRADLKWENYFYLQTREKSGYMLF